MKWPSTRFFQSIGLAGFTIGVYNAIASAAQRRGNISNIDKIKTIGKEVNEISENIEKIAELHSRGNIELKQQIIENLHKKIDNKINNNYNPLRDQLDNVNQAIVDYLKIQTEIQDKMQRSQFITDPYLKQQIDNNIANLQTQANGKFVLIHDTINSINSYIYIAKTHIQEAIDQLRRGGNNFTDSFYKYIEDFNNWVNNLDHVHNIAIVNLFGIFVIIVSLISIVFIFYGNILLDYLNLEQRYPKIAKIILLRRKFQKYYLFLNIFIIAIVSIVMFLMNLTLFF